MANEIIHYQKCPRCNGTGDPGVITNGGGLPIPNPVCPTCNGELYVSVGKIDVTDLQSDLTICKRRLKKIMDNLGIGDD